MAENWSSNVIRMKNHEEPTRWYEGVIKDMVIERDALDRAVRRASWILRHFWVFMTLAFLCGAITFAAVQALLRYLR